ncbi:THAP domain-containing protein 1, partial [Stegodyphus mimosarum]
NKFPFPNKERLNKWVSSLHRKDFVPTAYSFICSKHFTPDYFYEKHMSRKILKENAVPTIFDSPEHLK